MTGHREAPDETTATASVTVVIVTYESSRCLPGCLAALGEAMEGVDRWEVVVVDNASTDGTPAVAAEAMPGASVVHLGSNRGYAAGVNAGMAAGTRTDAVLVMNPDVRLGRGSVRKLLQALGSPSTGIAVPRLVDGSGRLQHSLRREPTVLRALAAAVLGGDRAARVGRLGEVVSDAAAYERRGTATWATGAVMLISRRCIDAVGTWDESFVLYSEETEFCLRAGEAGFTLAYEPSALAVHLGGESNVSPRLWRLLTVNRVRLYRRRHGPLRSGAFWLAVVVNETVRSWKSTHRAALGALIGADRHKSPAELLADPGGEEPPDYVCFSAQDWWYHNRAHSDFQLMRGVAAHRRVLFVNSITMRMPLPGRSAMAVRRIRRKLASMLKALRRPDPALPAFHVFTPILVPLYGFAWGRALNASLVRLQVTLAARRIGIRRPPVVIVTIPTAWDVVRRMKRRSLVYNRSDKHSAFTEAHRGQIADLEAKLLASSDAVLYVSRALMEAESDRTAGRAYFLDHGVDLDHFDRARLQGEPPDLASVPRPRIGFFGGLDDYIVDFDLLERLAVEIPEAQLLLVGDATCSMKRFERFPNVHWLGFRPYEAIPDYGAGFDVAIMPWLQNEWVAHCNPIKLKEYLALGLPVVSTDFPEVHRYAEWVGIASDGDDFIQRVRTLVHTPRSGAGARGAVVASSWAAKVSELLALCERRAGTPASEG